MEDHTSSTKEVAAKGAPVYYPWSFSEVIRAILRCLGLEPLFHQNPSCPKKEDDDGKVLNDIQAAAGCQESSVASSEQGSDPPSTSAADNSDPPISDPPSDPPSTTGDPSVAVTLAAPGRPGTSSGSGPQIN
ncbi:hypothetical protein PTKIN_Ptkin09bG0071000 [Pterospermum kingtungense]